MEKNGINITPGEPPDTLTGRPYIKGSSYAMELEERLTNVREEVKQRGCLARGTQEICNDCGILITAQIIEKPVCQTLNDTIETNE